MNTKNSDKFDSINKLVKTLEEDRENIQQLMATTITPEHRMALFSLRRDNVETAIRLVDLKLRLVEQFSKDQAMLLAFFGLTGPDEEKCKSAVE